MASKDPAFLFYPGDYLRDTQCLSEASQVAYDRIMCEHMRNICLDMSKIIVTKSKHEFFTKRLTPDEKEEILSVLNEVPGGYQIEWVARSMSERKAYTESRSKNRTSKKKEKSQNISSTYEPHMDNEDENVIEDEKGKEIGNKMSEKTKEVFEALKIKFDINEQKHFSNFRELSTFCMVLQSTNFIDHFIFQFEWYHKYKKKADVKLHQFKGFIGTIEKKYQDGGWNAENWKHLYDNYNGKQQTGNNLDEFRASLIADLQNP